VDLTAGANVFELLVASREFILETLSKDAQDHLI